MGERKNSRTGLETRDRIIDAALQSVRDEGLVGTSARVIARTGGFNQALVFYHFGSVDELLLAALERANDRRMETFRERLEAVDSLEALVDVAVDLHSAEEDSDHVALSAIVAGWSSKSEFGPQIVATLQPWDDMIADALRRSLADTPFARVTPTEDLAHGVGALFLGIELMSRLDPADKRTESLFAALTTAAKVAGPILDALAARKESD